MAEAAFKLVETEEVETKALTIVDQAKAVIVRDSQTYTAAGIVWKSLGEMLTEIDNAFDENISLWHKGHKAAVAKKAQYYVPVKDARSYVKSIMSTYDAAQEAIRKAEEERLAAIARAEEEARRKAEQERLEAERKAEEERLLAEAIAADERGDKDTAEILTDAAAATSENIRQEAAALAQEPIYVPPVVVPKAVPKMVGGPVYREVWSAEVTDIKALCMAVATGKASTECVVGNIVSLNRQAVALKGTMNVPGVRAYSKRV